MNDLTSHVIKKKNSKKINKKHKNKNKTPKGTLRDKIPRICVASKITQLTGNIHEG